VLVPEDEPEKFDPPMVPEAVMLPSAVRLSTAPPVTLELTKARVVAEASERSMVYVPDAILWMVVSVGAMVRMLLPESKVNVLVVEAMVRAPESVIVCEPKVSVPTTVPVTKLPTDVSDELTTVEFRVVPVRVPAAAVTVMSALPLKETPLINLGVVKVAADPVVFWFNVGKSEATAMVRAPVVVVLFKIPVARADVPAE